MVDKPIDHQNLFGYAALDHALTPVQRKELENAARSASRSVKGHAWRPGTGPKGETCKSCRHTARVGTRAGKVFRKCGLMRSRWTHGPGSDIRAKDPACLKWEKPE